MPGMTPWMMSSRLGFVAEVMATESPSQESPVVTHRTCAVIASVFSWPGTNSTVPDIGPPTSGSTDAGQGVAHQLVHDPLAAEGGRHQHHPGWLRLHFADLRRALAARDRAQRAQGRLRRLGSD